MDTGTIISIIALLVSILIGGPTMWLIRINNRDLKETKDELSSFRTHVAEHYVPVTLMDKMLERERNGIHREFDEIKKMITRLFAKLDSKDA